MPKKNPRKKKCRLITAIQSSTSAIDGISTNNINTDNIKTNKTEKISNGNADRGRKQKQPICENQSIGNKENNIKNDVDEKEIVLLSKGLEAIRWACGNCSFSYNGSACNKCEVCNRPKPPPTLTQPATTTFTNDSSHCNVLPQECDVGTLDQAYKDAVQFYPGLLSKHKQDSTCKKCHKLNSAVPFTCETCHKTIGPLPCNETLQKDKFWCCSKCKVKNTLRSFVCKACKTKKKNSNVVIPPKNDLNNNKGHVNLSSDIDQIDAGSSPSIEPWHCGICNFQNTMTNTLCNMCLQPKTKRLATSPAKLTPEELSRKRWSYIVRTCKSKRELFVDKTFPPSLSCFSYFHQNLKDRDIKFTRLRNTFVEDDCKHLPWTVFSTPDPSDVLQGYLGDCWLLSGLAVLAERVELVKAVVITQELCPQGVYEVRLCKDGNWVTLIVDDFVPAGKNGVPFFSQATRKQLWVPLLEKAMAKLYGCYAALIRGRAIEALATLTGAPCENILLYSIAEYSDNDELDLDLIWSRLLSAKQASFLIGATCDRAYDKLDEAKFTSVGLQPFHVYSVLDIREINEHRLLKLRNPWGRGQWTGPWSNNSAKWTAGLRAALLPEESQDGTFWISFYDMLNYFVCFDICKVRDDWNVTRLSGVLPPLASLEHLTCIRLAVLERCEVNCTLFQKGQRHLERSKRLFLDLCVVIVKVGKGSNKIGALIQHSNRQLREFVGCNGILEPGEYLVIPLTFNHWGKVPLDPSAFPRYVLTIHSTKKILAKQIPPSPYMLADSLIALAVAHGQKLDGSLEMSSYYLIKSFVGAMIIVENQKANKWLNVCCNFLENSNLVSTRGTCRTRDCIPPLHRQVIMVLTQLVEDNWSVGHQFIARFVDSPGLHDWGPKGSSHYPELNSQIIRLHSPRSIA